MQEASGSTTFPIGKLAILLAVLQEHEWKKVVEQELKSQDFRYTIGRVGAMDMIKVIAAIETAAKNNNIIGYGLFLLLVKQVRVMLEVPETPVKYCECPLVLSKQDNTPISSHSILTIFPWHRKKNCLPT
ncbi:HutP family protein [Paenibacillus sp. 19GGS1-52]|uniref:HutP family protein n=1 Tax=Paenibacillus sp. 19GGS1-52 TaxID=2758563 RepID=UPI001EFC146D|nr:HutP family protein [Paenibacillus sp. 19GGS1-52]